MVVWLYARPLDKSVAAIEELADISTKVLLKHEFTSGVQLLIAVKVEDEIIEDDEWDSSSNTLVNLLRGVNHGLIVPVIPNYGRLDNHARLHVLPSVDQLEEDDKDAEGQHAKVAEVSLLVILDNVTVVVENSEHGSQVGQE